MRFRLRPVCAGVVESLKIVTRPKCLRITKFAFDYATKHGRKKVTAVHKANIMKLGDGLFLRCAEEVAKLYPHIQFENMIIDNCCMQVLRYISVICFARLILT